MLTECFDASVSGLVTAGTMSRAVREVAADAASWVRAEGSGIVVHHIAISQSQVSAHAVVFYDVAIDTRVDARSVATRSAPQPPAPQPPPGGAPPPLPGD